jgi:hypothetical protein
MEDNNKSAYQSAFIKLFSGEAKGARTLDPQNHNLML